MKRASFLRGFAAAVAGLCAATPDPASQTLDQRLLGSRQTSYCTFRAYQVQLCEATSPTVYLQINEIRAPDESVLVDVRSQRPRQEFNSYHRLNRNEPWTVTSVGEDGLTVTLNITTLQFEKGDLVWTEMDGEEDGSKGWCEPSEWFEGSEGWNCTKGEEKRPRKRNLTCGFPCWTAENSEL